MTDSSREGRLGPLESRPWPTALDAFAITPGAAPRLMGYDVENELAGRIAFTEFLYLALTGDLPSREVSSAFSIVVAFALPLSVAHAPIHAAALSRLCGARPSGVMSVASLALAEDFAELLERTKTVTEPEWALSRQPLPAELRATSVEERASVARLASLLHGLIDVPLFALDPSRSLALIAALRVCGLHSDMQLISVMTLARLPSAIAEAAPRQPLAFTEYPTNLPPYVYEAKPQP